VNLLNFVMLKISIILLLISIMHIVGSGLITRICNTRGKIRRWAPICINTPSEIILKHFLNIGNYDQFFSVELKYCQIQMYFSMIKH